MQVGESSSEKFILTHVLPSCLRAASKCGINVLEFVQEVGVSPLTLIPGHGDLPLRELFNLLNEGVRAGWSADPGGHIPMLIAEAFHFDYLPDATAYLQTSPNLIEASRLFGWISTVICPPARMEFHMNQELVTVVLKFEGVEFSDPRVCWSASETILASWYKLACQLSTKVEAPHSVEFRHARHIGHAACEAFFGVPCQFESFQDAITLPRAWVEQSLETSVPVLHDYAKTRLRRSLPSPSGDLGRPPILSNVFDVDTLDEGGFPRLLFEHLVSQPGRLSEGVADVADALGVPVRTLQRRMSEADTSFSKVQSKARLFIAKTMLLNHAISIDAVAMNAGFPDRRTFASFFKRMTGQTPRVWRSTRSKP